MPVVRTVSAPLLRPWPFPPIVGPRGYVVSYLLVSSAASVDIGELQVPRQMAEEAYSAFAR